MPSREATENALCRWSNLGLTVGGVRISGVGMAIGFGEYLVQLIGSMRRINVCPLRESAVL